MVHSACSWDCKIPASARKLQEFTSHCCLQSRRMKLEVNLSALKKHRCKFNWVAEVLLLMERNGTLYFQGKLFPLRLAIYKKVFCPKLHVWRLLWSTVAIWNHSMFGCQVQFRHMVLLQGFSNCNTAWGWFRFHLNLIILSRGYTVSCPAHLRNQTCLVVSSKKPKHLHLQLAHKKVFIHKAWQMVQSWLLCNQDT